MKSFCVSMFVVVACLVTSAARAGDEKVYSMISCQQEGTSGTLHLDASGRVWNYSSTSTLTIDCPIIRDQTGISISSGHYYALDQHFTQDITCTIADLASDGSTYLYTDTKTTSGTSSSAQKLVFGALGNNNSEDYETLRCVIPPTYSGVASGILSYKITE